MSSTTMRTPGMSDHSTRMTSMWGQVRRSRSCSVSPAGTLPSTLHPPPLPLHRPFPLCPHSFPPPPPRQDTPTSIMSLGLTNCHRWLPLERSFPTPPPCPSGHSTAETGRAPVSFSFLKFKYQHGFSKESISAPLARKAWLTSPPSPKASWGHPLAEMS